ncbi:MAG: glycosyltransferase [Acidobacteriota bacterium]
MSSRQREETAQTTAGLDEAPPLAVMFVANPFVYDTRVEKQAQTLLDWGFRVRVLCRADASLPALETRRGVQIERLGLRRRDFVTALVFALFPPPGFLARAFLRRPNRTPTVGLKSAPSAVLAKSGPSRFKWQRLVTRWLPPSAPRLSFCIGFARRAATEPADVVVSHDLDTLLAGVLLSRAFGTPLLYDSHELFVERNVGVSPRWKERLFWGRLERRLIRRADRVTTVAEGIATELAETYGIERPALIRNVQRYQEPIGESSALRRKIGVAESKRLVIYAGALTFNRGLEQLIEASAFLAEDAAFVVMGYAHDPEYLKGLLKRARDRGTLGTSVFFTEAVPSEDVARYVAGAALGIVPTQAICRSYEYEASNKIFHCVMAGVPLAMSDHSEKRALVAEWDIGVLFDEKDPSEIARVVNVLLANEPRRRDLAENCLTAARTLNWDHEELRYRDLIQRLVPDLRLRPVAEVGAVSA